MRRLTLVVTNLNSLKTSFFSPLAGFKIELLSKEGCFLIPKIESKRPLQKKKFTLFQFLLPLFFSSDRSSVSLDFEMFSELEYA